MATDKEIVSALENEYDGLDKFSLVEEILGLQTDLDTANKRIEVLEDAMNEIMPFKMIPDEIQYIKLQALKQKDGIKTRIVDGDLVHDKE